MGIDSPLKWHGGKSYLASRLWEIAKGLPRPEGVSSVKPGS
jgi:site-specific DNA-adenine methylase